MGKQKANQPHLMLQYLMELHIGGQTVQKMQLMQSIGEQQLQQAAPLPTAEVGDW